MIDPGDPASGPVSPRVARRGRKIDRNTDLYSFESLWRAYRDCRRHKRNTINALAFEIDLEAKLLQLQGELREHRYRPGQSICFLTEGPKRREVFAADFRDRVVHHLLISRLDPVFERVFIHDSYACRRGKGVLAASDRLMEFLRCATANGRRPGWAMKLDVSSFFPSIHKQTLFDIIWRRVRDPELRWLTTTILFHDPTRNYRFKQGDVAVAPPGTPDYPVPTRKSLFGRGNERGLPIGNLTSQFWANVYLNEVDQFAKRKLPCRFYVRYVDDMVFLAADPEQLIVWREQVRTFLRDWLRLELRSDGCAPFPLRQGVDFVGWKTWHSHRVPRRQTLRSADLRLRRLQQRLVRPVSGGGVQRIELIWSAAHSDQPSEERDVEGCLTRLRSTLASYSGHLRCGAAMASWAELLARHSWVRAVYHIDAWRIEERWANRRLVAARRFSVQYGGLVRGAGQDCLVFCQVGRFVEFRGPQRLLAETTLQLKRAHIPRANLGYSAGFPLWQSSVYRRRALQEGWIVADVREQNRQPGERCVRRQVISLMLASYDSSRESAR